tara:strand:+ start:762 stop:1316 length:555 start_codon:yes stop_codon:yes gene_type:complete
MIFISSKKKAITFLFKRTRISRESIQKLDLLLLILETIDLNGVQSFYSVSNKLYLDEILPNKVTIWKLRNNNPMRKSYIKNNIKIEEFEALTKVAAEMSKYLYPYIREILQSRDNMNTNSVTWIDFKNRFVELIYERFNINSMRVKKLLDPDINDRILIKSLLTLAFCISDDGYHKLRKSLLSF